MNHEQRLRYKAIYLDLSSKGLPESKINERLLEVYRLEEKTSNEGKQKTPKKVSPRGYESDKNMKGSNSTTVLSKASPNKNDTSPRQVSAPRVPKTNLGSIGEDKSVKIYCDTCQIYFKSDALLERHLKYSHFHARLFLEKEKARTQEERAKRIALLIHESIRKVAKILKQRDGLMTSARLNKPRK